MTIPTVSINQVQPYYGRGDSSAKPNAHCLKVWSGWDSPIVNRMISVFGQECRQLESFLADGIQETSFFLVMGDGSQTQWEVWAPSPLLFVEGLSTRSIAEASAWIGYTETGHRDGMSEEQLSRCFRADCDEARFESFDMKLDLEGTPRLSTSKSYSSLRGFKTREEFEAHVKACRTKESTGSCSTFKRIVYSWGDLEVSDFVYDRAGMTQVIYATEEEFKAAIVVAFSPMVDRINTAIDKLESLVRSGESISVIESSIAISSYGSDSYHLSLPIGASGQISIKRHRGEISSAVRSGGVSMLQGKSA